MQNALHANPGLTFTLISDVLSLHLMKSSFALIVLALCLQSPLSAQTPENEAPPTTEQREAMKKQMIETIEKFGWTRDGEGKLGDRAKVSIPRGYRFTGPSGTQKMLELFENIPSKKELGMLTTEGLGPWVIFEFNDVGYVKDDEKDSLDADALLKQNQEGQEHANEVRRERGLPELEITGWAVPPRYNDQTKNLEWALRVRTKGQDDESINFYTKLLGRKGIMEVALLCSPDEMEKLMPDYQEIMARFSYTEGESYAEFRSGDKIAEYGLAALVAGGAAVAAGKLGLFGKLGALFAKMGKAVILVIIAIGAVIKGIWSRITGSGRNA